MYYIHQDHLGSYDVITTDNKVVSERHHFDPWGNRKNPTNWLATDTRTSFLFDRGFTGHEHLDIFKIINMNARLYDPVIGRFFSPDPYVQAPELTQGFNRYSYCLNNPLKYVDPSGGLFRKFEDYETGTFLGEIDDGIEETFRIAKSDFEHLKKTFENYSRDIYDNLFNAFGLGTKGYAVAMSARKKIGSNEYAYNVKKDAFGIGTYKCNKFVYDMLLQNDAIGAYPPPTAAQYADYNRDIEGLSIINIDAKNLQLGDIKLGDVIGGARSSTGATGHVEIVGFINLDGSFITIGAPGNDVRYSYFGYKALIGVPLRDSNGRFINYSPVTVRRIQ